MKSRMGETCRMMLREATDMDKQDKQVLRKKKMSFGHPEQATSSCEFEYS